MAEYKDKDEIQFVLNHLIEKSRGRNEIKIFEQREMKRMIKFC